MSDVLNTYIVDYRGKAYKVKAENLLDAWEVFKKKHISDIQINAITNTLTQWKKMVLNMPYFSRRFSTIVALSRITYITKDGRIH